MTDRPVQPERSNNKILLFRCVHLERDADGFDVWLPVWRPTDNYLAAAVIANQMEKFFPGENYGVQMHWEWLN